MGGAEKLEADQILSDAKANRDEIEKECNERLEQVAIKEEKIEFDLQANEQIKKLYEARKEELNEREKVINNKFRILERHKK